MIRLSDVVKEYESGTTALKGISLRIEDGEFVFLVGPSGSGKSTIIKLLTGEIVPTSGQIAVNGFSLTNIAERQIPLLRRSVGVIFQDFRLIEKKTVYENLGFAMRAVGSSPREIKKRIPYVLELGGLGEKGDICPAPRGPPRRRANVPLFPQAPQLQHIGDALFDLARRRTDGAHGEAQVLVDRFLLDQAEVLEDDADGAAQQRDLPLGNVRQAEAVDGDLTGRRHDLAGEQLDDRRLAAAARADQKDELPILDAKRNAL